MSQNKALLPHLRRQKIKELIANTTQEEIAKQCGCERNTIVRDIRHMKSTGEWWEWIEHELHRLHKDGEVTDETKYREMAKLYAKQFIKEKREDTVQGNINLRWMNKHEPDTDDTIQSP